MKKFRLIALALIGAFSFNACEITEPCETDNYGSVIINNKMDKTYAFDVTYEKNNNGEWLDNEEVDISASGSYNYEKINAGTAAVWIQYDNGDWFIAETIDVSNCNATEVTYNKACEVFGTGDAIVENNLSFAIVVDIKIDDNFVEEVTLQPGEYVTYTVSSGNVEFWGSAVGSDEWTYTDPYILVECGEFTFSWEDNKSASLHKSTKPLQSNNKDVKAVKVAR